MDTAVQKVHPNCVYRTNPYHECVESCFGKMEEAGRVQKSKKNPGSLILVVPRQLSFNRKKKKGSDAAIKPSKSFDNTSDLKKAVIHPDSPSTPPNLSFDKVESWNCDIPFTGKDQEKAHFEDASFVKSSPKSKPAPKEQPNGDLKEAKSTENGDRNDDDEKPEDYQNPVDSFDATNNDNANTKVVVPFEMISDEETSDQPIICDSRVQVGDHYYVKGSLASIMRSILNKYGDIAKNCKLTSVLMRSNYLECLCHTTKELQTTSFDEISNSKLKEMWAITKDVEAVGIEVGWLQNILDEIGAMVELVKERKSVESKKKKCETYMDSAKVELEARLQDLAEKEKEVAHAKARVEESQERLSKLEQDCSQLNEAISSIKLKVDSIDCKAKVDEIL